MSLSLLLAGGGIDSMTALVYLRKRDVQLHALFFRYGQTAEVQEAEACRYFCSKWDVPLHEVTIPMFMKSAISGAEGASALDPRQNRLEVRNFILVAYATQYAALLNVDALVLGFHQEPRDSSNEYVFPDASPEFRYAVEAAATAALGRPLYVQAPFVAWERWEILRLGHVLAPDDLPYRAFTCYTPASDGRACGQCAHCVQLRANAEKANVRLDRR